MAFNSEKNISFLKTWHEPELGVRRVGQLPDWTACSLLQLLLVLQQNSFCGGLSHKWFFPGLPNSRAVHPLRFLNERHLFLNYPPMPVLPVFGVELLS